MKQQSLFSEKIQKEFGGSLLKKGKRKSARPLSVKAPIHLVLKAHDQILLFQKKRIIEAQTKRLGKKFGVRIYSLAPQGDHIHAVVKIPTRRLYLAWIRSLTGTLSRKITGLKFRHRPYSRILTWGREYKKVLNYLMSNQREAHFLEQAWNRFDDFEKWLTQVVPLANSQRLQQITERKQWPG